MKHAKFRSRFVCLGAALGLSLAVGCGGGGGGGGGTATVNGNLSSAGTAAVHGEKRSWLAWAGEEILGLAHRAYAAANTALGGVTVTITGAGGGSSTDTDSNGDFTVGNAPTGNVTVAFAHGSCETSDSLDDVTDGSTLDLKDVSLDCNGHKATVSELDETFQAVLENKPASPNGNLNVCAFGGGGNHIRAVKTKDGAQFENSSGGAATFADLQEGDLLEVTGQRAGLGANSAVSASLVKIISSGHTGNCAGLSTPTPEPTGTQTPAASGTPTATPTASPTPTM